MSIPLKSQNKNWNWRLHLFCSVNIGSIHNTCAMCTFVSSNRWKWWLWLLLTCITLSMKIRCFIEILKQSFQFGQVIGWAVFFIIFVLRVQWGIVLYGGGFRCSLWRWGTGCPYYWGIKVWGQILGGWGDHTFIIKRRWWREVITRGSFLCGSSGRVLKIS